MIWKAVLIVAVLAAAAGAGYVSAPDGESKTIIETEYVDRWHNETVVVNQTETEYVYIASEGSEGPKLHVFREPEKYDFDSMRLNLCVSSTPLFCAPWTGNGPPYLVLYIKDFDDTGILIDGYAHRIGFAGFDACSVGTLRFPEWTTYEELNDTSRQRAWHSTPVPENPYDLLGSGNNCYARAHVQTAWIAGICIEGDGVLSPVESHLQPNGDTHQYVDAMDYCGRITYEWRAA